MEQSCASCPVCTHFTKHVWMNGSCNSCGVPGKLRRWSNRAPLALSARISQNMCG